MQIKNRSKMWLALYVYIDLCYFRGWQGVRLISSRNNNFLFIFAINPKKNGHLEVFFPIRSTVKLKFETLFKLFTCLRLPKEKSLRFINIAFIEQDTTVTYYRIVKNFNKICGPIGK